MSNKHATQAYFPDIAPCGARRGGETKFAWKMADVTCQACRDAIARRKPTAEARAKKRREYLAEKGWR